MLDMTMHIRSAYKSAFRLAIHDFVSIQTNINPSFLDLPSLYLPPSTNSLCEADLILEYVNNVQVEKNMNHFSGFFGKENSDFIIKPCSPHFKLAGMGYALKDLDGKTFIRFTFPYLAKFRGEIIDLCYSVLLLKLLCRNVTIIHSACISFDGEKATLIVAGHDVGKTALVLSAIRDGFYVLSDDFTLLDSSANAYSYMKPITLTPYHLRAFKLKCTFKDLLIAHMKRHISGLPVIPPYLPTSPSIGLRKQITDLFDQVKIVRKAKLEQIVILQKSPEEAIEEIEHEQMSGKILAINRLSLSGFYNNPAIVAYTYFNPSIRTYVKNCYEREEMIVSKAVKNSRCFLIKGSNFYNLLKKLTW